MGCCGDREKFGSATNEQRWDYLTLADFKSSSCWTGFSYGFLIFMLIVSVVVYIVDLYTAANLLFFDRWSSQVKPAIPFQISRWVFAGCIILSWVLLAHRWWRAIRAMKSGIVTASYLDPLAVRIESVRPGQAQGWRRFLVFTALTKGRKGSEYVALFTLFTFEAWLRIIFAEGPRNVINAVTLYSVLRAELIPVGQHAPVKGQTPVGQFFDNIGVLAHQSTRQATILFGMLYVLIVWVITAISLFIAFLMYILFLWHHIPSSDGSLSRFCRRKIEKRLNQIVRARVDKAIAKEHLERVKKIATGGSGASVGMPTQPKMDVKRQPTLPNLDSDAPLQSLHASRPSTSSINRPASPFGTRPASPFIDRPASPRPGGPSKSALSREPMLPGLENSGSGTSTPAPLSRAVTHSSLNSNASYTSDAPLLGGAADMGQGPRGAFRPPGALPRRDSDRSMASSIVPPSRQGPHPNMPPLRVNTAMSSRPTTPGSHNQMRTPGSRDPSSASVSQSGRRPGPNFSRRPMQEFEMTTPADSGPNTPASAPMSSRTLPPSRGPGPMDYFGEQNVPSRAGTAPIYPQSQGYDDSIFDAYGARNVQPPRPNTTGPRPGFGARPPLGGRPYNDSPGPGQGYRPPRF